MACKDLTTGRCRGKGRGSRKSPRVPSSGLLAPGLRAPQAPVRQSVVCPVHALGVWGRLRSRRPVSLLPAVSPGTRLRLRGRRPRAMTRSHYPAGRVRVASIIRFNAHVTPRRQGLPHTAAPAAGRKLPAGVRRVLGRGSGSARGRAQRRRCLAASPPRDGVRAPPSAGRGLPGSRRAAGTERKHGRPGGPPRRRASVPRRPARRK